MEFSFLIHTLCACFWWFWCLKLTTNRGLLDFIPKYYPAFLHSRLSCPHCMSCWTSFFICIYYFLIGVIPILGVLCALFVPACIVNLIGEPV